MKVALRELFGEFGQLLHRRNHPVGNDDPIDECRAETNHQAHPDEQIQVAGIEDASGGMGLIAAIEGKHQYPEQRRDIKCNQKP